MRAVEQHRHVPLAARQNTFLEPAILSYGEWLKERGYSRFTIEHYLVMTRHFGCWLTRRRLGDLAAVNEEVATQFVASHLPRCHCYITRHLPRPRRYEDAAAALRGFLTMLREQGLLPQLPAPMPPSSPAERLVDDFGDFLRHHRGLIESSIVSYQRVARDLLATLPEDDLPAALAALRLTEVRAFALDHANLPLSRRRTLKCGLSAFFGYLRLAGYSTLEVTEALPPVRRYRLASLPVAISTQDVQRLLAAVDQSARSGRRDYAMLLLLATYGLRSHEVCRLRLEDIDWRRQRLLIRAGKTARERMLPLTEPVADALYDYLRHERRPCAHREVFLSERPPCGPFRRNPHHMISKYFWRAQIDSPHRGAHTLRHSFAVQGVRAGLPLKTIGDLLGHRHPDTTLIYTKLQVEDLREVAMGLEVSR